LHNLPFSPARVSFTSYGPPLPPPARTIVAQVMTINEAIVAVINILFIFYLPFRFIGVSRNLPVHEQNLCQRIKSV